MLSFFPRDVLDEICDLIKSVFEGSFMLILYNDLRSEQTVHLLFHLNPLSHYLGVHFFFLRIIEV